MKIRQRNNSAKGFTIIEVMIVLAIAGLIIGVVLVAIPQLQRNQRNEARRSILGRIKTEVDNYTGNNNGRIPANATDVTSFVSRYMTGVNYEDPRSGTNMAITWPTSAVIAGVPSGGSLPAVGSIFYRSSFSCNGESLVASSARQYALWTQLEGGAIYCLDNE